MTLLQINASWGKQGQQSNFGTVAALFVVPRRNRFSSRRRDRKILVTVYILSVADILVIRSSCPSGGDTTLH